MTISCDKQKYNYYFNCLKQFLPEYCSSVQKSLVVDDALYKLGFSKSIVYTFIINVKEEDARKVIAIINNYHISNYDKFEYFVEFYNLLKQM